MGWNRAIGKRKKGVEKLYDDVVVDLETLATDTHTAVLSIGAVRFRVDTVDSAESIGEEDRTFYARLDEHQQERDGRSVDPDTVSWWADQSETARAVFAEEPEDTAGALARFVEFCRGARRIWGNGNMFDNAIIRDLCEQYDQPYPVGFRSDLDLRTLLYVWRKLKKHRPKWPVIPEGVEYDHTALSDAKHEALQIQSMYQDLKGNQNGT